MSVSSQGNELYKNPFSLAFCTRFSQPTRFSWFLTSRIVFCASVSPVILISKIDSAGSISGGLLLNKFRTSMSSMRGRQGSLGGGAAKITENKTWAPKIRHLRGPKLSCSQPAFCWWITRSSLEDLNFWVASPLRILLRVIYPCSKFLDPWRIIKVGSLIFYIHFLSLFTFMFLFLLSILQNA